MHNQIRRFTSKSKSPAPAAWKTALEDNGYRVRQIKEPVIGHKIALGVMISCLKAAIDKLGLAIK